VLHAQRGDIKQALQDFQAAYELQPSVRHLEALGWLLARSGRREQALARWKESLNWESEDLWDGYRRAALRLALSDQDGYRAECERLLERFGDTADPFVAERTAKACLLSSQPVGDPRRLLHLTEIAANVENPLCWFLLAKGLAQYRLGEFTPSIESVEAGLKLFHGYDTCADATLLAILAMNHHRLGHSREASEAMQQALHALQEQERVDPNDTPGKNWHDWLMCRLLVDEAEDLLQGFTTISEASPTASLSPPLQLERSGSEP
jgi:tetratricopeptide (TPR) repeat protein